jgi:predicted nucleotidyltransferase
MNKPIVKILFGSHLYGTTTPASDLDYKAVHIPSAPDILLRHSQDSVPIGKRAKGENEKNNPEDVDYESYSLQRYLQLLADGQTVAIDMLFAPDANVLETSRLWEHIRHNKEQFLSKRSTAFVGYCRTQANKYGIKGSRVAAARKAADFFAKMLEQLGTTAKISEVAWRLAELKDDHTDCVQLPMSSNKEVLGWYFECCNRKVCFTNTIKQAAEVYGKVFANYGSRAQLAEANEGVDWKALSHAVRVGEEALELLQTGKITLPLPNAPHILDIKLGYLPYNLVAKEIEELLERVEQAALVSSLPESPNLEFIDKLVFNVYREQVICYD